MKIIAALVLTISLAAVPAFSQNKLKEKHRLEFKNLLPHYFDFADIKALLLNLGDKSIFLSSFHHQAAARLVRFNDESGE